MRCSGDKNPPSIDYANLVRELFVCKTCMLNPKYAPQKTNTARFGTKNRYRLQNLMPFSAGQQVRLRRKRPYLVLSHVGFYAQITYHGRRLRKHNLTLARLRAERRGLLIL